MPHTFRLEGLLKFYSPLPLHIICQIIINNNSLWTIYHLPHLNIQFYPITVSVIWVSYYEPQINGSLWLLLFISVHKTTQTRINGHKTLCPKEFICHQYIKTLCGIITLNQVTIHKNININQNIKGAKLGCFYNYET